MLPIFVFQGFNDASTKFLWKDVPRQQFASLNCSCDTVFSLVSMNLKYSTLSLLSYTHQNIKIYRNSKYVYIISLTMYIPVCISTDQRKNLCLNLDCRKNNF